MNAAEPIAGAAQTWRLLAYAGRQPEWVHQLVQRIEPIVKANCRVGGATPWTLRRSAAARGMWAMDTAMRRVSAGLELSELESSPVAASSCALCITLSDEESASATQQIAVRVGGRPAVEVVQAVESAMLSGAGEVDIEVRWRRGTATVHRTWRAAIVESSLGYSFDLVTRKLVGLLVHCLSQPGQFERASIPESPVARPGRASNSLAPAAGPLARLARRLTHKEQWAISVYEHVPADELWPRTPPIHLIPPSDRFWADPFLVRDGDRLWVFFEEYPFAQARGKLCALAIDKDRQIGQPFDVLSEPFHLSYPNVFKVGDEWYMLPERSERHDLVLYKSHAFPQDWRPVATLLTDVNLVDATLYRDARGWRILGSSEDSPGGAFTDTLHLYSAPDLFGPWQASGDNPVRSDPTCSRPAGPFFSWRGRLMRPAQDCRGRYGRAIHLLETLELGDGRIRERVVATLSGNSAAGISRVHTYCRTPTDLAVDWARWRPRWSLGDRPGPGLLNFEAIE